MNSRRYLIYAAVVVGVGMLVWVLTNPASATEQPTTQATAAPASTLPAGNTTAKTTTAAPTPNSPTGNPSTTEPTTVANSGVAEPAPTTTPTSDGAGSSTTVEAGDEGTADGTDPDSIAVSFVVAAFADCWSCDPDARQEHLGELASPDVVKLWPAMSVEERSAFTVRTVVVDNVVIKSDDTTQVAASLTTITDTGQDSTEPITVDVQVVDGIVTAVTPVDIEPDATETTSQ